LVAPQWEQRFARIEAGCQHFWHDQNNHHGDRFKWASIKRQYHC
jgi:hypothetical protein